MIIKIISCFIVLMAIITGGVIFISAIENEANDASMLCKEICESNDLYFYQIRYSSIACGSCYCRDYDDKIKVFKM